MRQSISSHAIDVKFWSPFDISIFFNWSNRDPTWSFGKAFIVFIITLGSERFRTVLSVVSSLLCNPSINRWDRQSLESKLFWKEVDSSSSGIDAALNTWENTWKPHGYKRQLTAKFQPSRYGKTSAFLWKWRTPSPVYFIIYDTQASRCSATNCMIYDWFKTY